MSEEELCKCDTYKARVADKERLELNFQLLEKISTQRAQFAAMAMQGLVTFGWNNRSLTAKAAVEMADALIEELKK